MVCHHGGYVVVDGYIYGNHEGGWSCLDLKTGEKKWGARGVGKGSIIYADGMLYTYGERGGRIALVEAKPDGFQSKGEFSVEGTAESWAHPSIAGGRLYLRFGDNLYCFDIRGPNYKEDTGDKKQSEVKPPAKTAAQTVTKSEPQPVPKTPPLPDTPEEHARRLWLKAENFLMHEATASGVAVLRELVEKYPDTEYGKKAGEKLKEFK